MDGDEARLSTSTSESSTPTRSAAIAGQTSWLEALADSGQIENQRGR